MQSRIVSLDTVMPSAGPLVPIAAVVAFLGILPTFSAVAAFGAGLVAALAAFLLGVPFLLMALRRHWTAWWQALAGGAFVALMTPLVGLLIVGLINVPAWRWSGAEVVHTVIAVSWSGLSIFAPLGAASGFVFWAVSLGMAIPLWKRWVAASIVVTLAAVATSGGLAWQAHDRDRATSERIRQQMRHR